MVKGNRAAGIAIDTPRIKRLMKEFAIKAGWPKVQQWQPCGNWEKLKPIPGSFPSENLPEDCPTDVIGAAFFDLLPTLLEQGHHGSYVAFGYGRHWYALGGTGREAMKNVMKKYPYQMPHIGGQISFERLNSPDVLRYLAWRLDKKPLEADVNLKPSPV